MRAQTLEHGDEQAMVRAAGVVMVIQIVVEDDQALNTAQEQPLAVDVTQIAVEDDPVVIVTIAKPLHN